MCNLSTIHICTTIPGAGRHSMYICFYMPLRVLNLLPSSHCCRWWWCPAPSCILAASLPPTGSSPSRSAAVAVKGGHWASRLPSQGASTCANYTQTCMHACVQYKQIQCSLKSGSTASTRHRITSHVWLQM